MKNSDYFKRSANALAILNNFNFGLLSKSITIKILFREHRQITSQNKGWGSGGGGVDSLSSDLSRLIRKGIVLL